jgi:catechol 2,3-dioxygenase-like lactoylglutathione lyase family enzyme
MSSEPTTATAPATTPFAYEGGMVISIGVSDLDASLRWYREALGFEVSYRMDDYGWAEVTTPVGRVSIGLGQVEDVKPGGTTPTFRVDDIADARRHLESLGVRFDGDTYEIAGQVKLATFYDPDGNSFMLAQALVG